MTTDFEFGLRYNLWDLQVHKSRPLSVLLPLAAVLYLTSWCFSPKSKPTSLQSPYRVLPHDCACCSPLHMNKQLFVEVQLATIGIATVTRMRGHLKLERETSLRSFAQWASLFRRGALSGFRFNCSSESVARSCLWCTDKLLTFSLKC